MAKTKKHKWVTVKPGNFDYSKNWGMSHRVIMFDNGVDAYTGKRKQRFFYSRAVSEQGFYGYWTSGRDTIYKHVEADGFTWYSLRYRYRYLYPSRTHYKSGHYGTWMPKARMQARAIAEADYGRLEAAEAGLPDSVYKVSNSHENGRIHELSWEDGQYHELQNNWKQARIRHQWQWHKKG